MDDINDERHIRAQELRTLHSAITDALGESPQKEAILTAYRQKLFLDVELGTLPPDYFEKWHDSLFDDLEKADTTP